MDTPAGPLNEQHLADINTQLAAIEAVKKQIDQAKRANIDVGALENEVQAMEKQFRLIKSVYFPGQ